MKDQETVLIGAAMIAAAVLAGSYIIAHKLSTSLDEKDFWAGSNIPAVASDVHNVTAGLNQISQAVQQWTRA